MRLHTDEFVAMVGDRSRAEQIMRDWHGHRIPELTAAKVSRETLYAEIRASLRAGCTYAEAAEHHQVSRYTVWRAVNWSHKLRNVS